MRTPLEELIEQLNEDGWFVSGWYQMSADHWYISLRRFEDWSTVHGSGATARNALLDAWKRAPKKSMTDADWEKFRVVGTCSVCGKPQFRTPSGPACREGHGGAPSKEENSGGSSRTRRRAHSRVV